VLAEPTGRRLLRIGFGLLWLLDGILQAQPAMPPWSRPQRPRSPPQQKHHRTFGKNLKIF
jgi:hypothetical protein